MESSVTFKAKGFITDYFFLKEYNHRYEVIVGGRVGMRSGGRGGVRQGRRESLNEGH